MKVDYNTFMSEKEIKQAEQEARSVCVVVLGSSSDNSILAMTRKKEFNNIGLPGGKIELEDNEKSIDASVRECFEETGILVDKNSLVPLYYGFARSMMSLTYYAPTILGGKLQSETREGMPLWCNVQMLLKDDCDYKHYNLEVIKRLIEHGIL